MQIYETLDVSIRDLEIEKHGLSVQTANDKKLIKRWVWKTKNFQNLDEYFVYFQAWDKISILLSCVAMNWRGKSMNWPKTLSRKSARTKDSAVAKRQTQPLANHPCNPSHSAQLPTKSAIHQVPVSPKAKRFVIS